MKTKKASFLLSTHSLERNSISPAKFIFRAEIPSEQQQEVGSEKKENKILSIEEACDEVGLRSGYTNRYFFVNALHENGITLFPSPMERTAYTGAPQQNKILGEFLILNKDYLKGIIAKQKQPFSVESTTLGIALEALKIPPSAEDLYNRKNLNEGIIPNDKELEKLSVDQVMKKLCLESGPSARRELWGKLQKLPQFGQTLKEEYNYTTPHNTVLKNIIIKNKRLIATGRPLSEWLN